MKLITRVVLIVSVCLCLWGSIAAQWVKHSVDTTASLRGLSVVNEKVVWASGSGGTVIRTVDAGKTWKVIIVPGAGRLDFRDVEAFDANTAYILSIGNGELSRIYRTTDGGATWKEVFRNKNEKAFFDAIACWDRDNCLAMSDPVEGKFVLIKTKDGGTNWQHIASGQLPNAKEGEAAFAASGTCLILAGKYRKPMLVSGGTDARVFRANLGSHATYHWVVDDTPIISGSAGSGIFSIAMLNEQNGVIVGGNYEKPNEANDNVAFTTDGGQTWKLNTGLTGYRSGVTYVDNRTIIAVGTNGSDITRNGGKTWAILGKENLNAVAAKGRVAVWAVGPNGMVVKIR